MGEKKTVRTIEMTWEESEWVEVGVQGSEVQGSRQEDARPHTSMGPDVDRKEEER